MGKWQQRLLRNVSRHDENCVKYEFPVFSFYWISNFLMCLTRVFVAVFCFIIEHMCRQSLRKALMNALNLQHFPLVDKITKATNEIP